jgi:hypothetical protein
MAGLFAVAALENVSSAGGTCGTLARGARVGAAQKSRACLLDCHSHVRSLIAPRIRLSALVFLNTRPCRVLPSSSPACRPPPIVRLVASTGSRDQAQRLSPYGAARFSPRGTDKPPRSTGRLLLVQKWVRLWSKQDISFYVPLLLRGCRSPKPTIGVPIQS